MPRRVARACGVEVAHATDVTPAVDASSRLQSMQVGHSLVRVRRCGDRALMPMAALPKRAAGGGGCPRQPRAC
jgi:hypothetical protein